MLVWSRSGRFLVWLVAALLIGVIFIAPLAVILTASFAERWNGVLPTGFTFEHYAAAGSGDSGDAVFASLITGLVASLLALLSGSWAALALRAQGEAWSRSLGLLFFIPSAVPSVSVAHWAPGRLQPAAVAPQRHNGDRHPRPFRADLRLLVWQCLGRPRAIGAGLRRGRLESGRAPDLPADQCDAAADRALSDRRLRLELRPVDGRARGHGHGLSARLGDAAACDFRTDRSRRYFFGSGADQ